MQFLKRSRSNVILTALLTILLGVMMAAKPELTTSALCWVAGLVVLACGLCSIVAYIRGVKRNFWEFDLLVGLVEAALGIWILVKPTAILQFLSILVGIFVLVHGAWDLQNALDLRRYCYKDWWLLLILALGTLAFGLVVLFNPFSTFQVLTIFAGFCLIFDGVSDLIILWQINRATRILVEVKDIL
jgi:uncharacterized membrane protein HdeD (DUF308 family)